MNLLFRLLRIFIVSRFRKKVGPLGPCITPFRCWPTDLDLLRHMNNGKYFSIMDAARVDFMIRAGLKQIFADQGWFPVVVAETVRFRRSITLFQAFDIHTSIIGWDAEAILIRQAFVRRDETVCEAIVRGRFLKRSGGSVGIDELIAAVGVDGTSPALPQWIVDWNQQQGRRSE